MADIKYKLTYFNCRGLAEPIRFVLSALNIPFEDIRVTEKEWQTLKPKIPTHQLPYLEVTTPTGTTGYSESMAIARLIAWRNHLMGNGDVEYYKVEKMIGQCMDIEKECRKITNMTEGEERNKLENIFIKQKAPKILELVCGSLKASGGKFVAGDKPSLGDLYLLTVIDNVADIDPNLIKCPALTTHREAVMKTFPKLAEYIQMRDHTKQEHRYA